MNGDKPSPKKPEVPQTDPAADQWQKWLLQDGLNFDADWIAQLAQHPLRSLLIDGTLPSDDREHAELIVGCLCIGAPTVLREVLRRTHLSSVEFLARTTRACLFRFEPRLDPASARVLVDEFLIPSCATLQVLDLKFWDLADAKSVQVLCEGLAHCKVLRTLKLQDCKLNGLAVRAILDSTKGAWPVLEELSLSSNALGDPTAACLAERIPSLPSLKVLRLEGCDITHPGALALADALRGKHELVVLDLNMNLIGDPAAAAILDALSGSVSLSELDLTHCHLGTQSANRLGALLGSKTPLQTLRIGWNRMQATPAFIEGIRRNSTLRKLHLEHSGSAIFITQVVGALKIHPSLIDLRLHANPLNDKSTVQALTDVLPRSKLVRVDFSHCQFDDKCCSFVLDALAKISTLEVVILNNNHLQVRACGSAGNLLSISRTLRRLDLRSCAIDDEGAKALTRPLLKVKSPSLTRVDVSHNKIGSKGLGHLLQVMDAQPNLTTLLIGKNAFHLATPEVQTQFNHAILKSTSLTFVDYSKCNGSYAYDASTIERRLRVNARLTNPSTQKYLQDLVARFAHGLLGMDDVGPNIWRQLRDGLDPDHRYVRLRAALRLSEVCRGIRFGHGSRELLDDREAAEHEQLAAELQAQDSDEDDDKSH